MEKHFLLAVSGDRTASYNLRFIKSFFKTYDDIRVTLLYVAPRPSSWEPAEVVTPGPQALAELEAAKKAHGNEALDKAYDWITYHALPPERVDKKIVYSTLGTVGEIIAEAQKGLYDAVVLGRRGLSWFEELIADSVSHRILWKDIDFPIWICGRPSSPTEDDDLCGVLLCVDESAPAKRVADHVGFILAGRERHKVTLFHVKPDNVRITPKVQRILDDAGAALLDNGFHEKGIEIKIVEGKDVAQAIVDEAHGHGYAAVACGRTANEPSAMGALLPTSVTTKLLRKLTHSALWISK